MLWFALALVILFPSKVSLTKGSIAFEIWWTKYIPYLRTTETVSQPKQEESK